MKHIKGTLDFGCLDASQGIQWLLCHHYYLLFADHALDS